MVSLTFGEQVKIVLSRKGMTIKELAELIEEKTGKKMSRQNLTQRLGRDNFQEQDMRMIAEILGCSFQLSILATQEAAQKASVIEEVLPTTGELGRLEAKKERKAARAEAKKREIEERDLTVGEIVDMMQSIAPADEGETAENMEEAVENPGEAAMSAAGIIEETAADRDMTGPESAQDSGTESEAEMEAGGAPEGAAAETVQAEQPESARQGVAVAPEGAAAGESAPSEAEEFAASGEENPIEAEGEQPENEADYQAEPENEESQTARAEEKQAEEGQTEGKQAQEVSAKEVSVKGVSIKEESAKETPVEEASGDRETAGAREADSPREPERRASSSGASGTAHEKRGGFWSRWEKPKKKEEPSDFQPIRRRVDEDEDREKGDVNPYTGREYQSNSVRMHPKRIGYVQVYDRKEHKWTDMTEWAFLGFEERKKAAMGKDYEPPIYLD